LPSEDGVVERFKVSRTTVRKAIQNLVERGLVEVRRGKGTFVTLPKISQELTELTGFVEAMRALGRTPAARLLDKRIVAAQEAVAHQLALAPGTLVSGFGVFAWPTVWQYLSNLASRHAIRGMTSLQLSPGPAHGARILARLAALSFSTRPHLSPLSMQPHRTQSSGLRLRPSVS
jgi:DNA-binding transcriptional MocR family regulator